MHEEDAHDDNLIAIQTPSQIHTRAQMCAAENAVNSHILEISDLNDDIKSPLHVRNETPAVSATNEARENATLLPTILPPRASSDDDLAAARPYVEHNEASIYTQTWPTDLSIITALKITKPGAKSMFDLGVRCKARSETTRNMNAAFDSMMGGTILMHCKRHWMTLRHQS